MSNLVSSVTPFEECESVPFFKVVVVERLKHELVVIPAEPHYAMVASAEWI